MSATTSRWVGEAETAMQARLDHRRSAGARRVRTLVYAAGVICTVFFGAQVPAEASIRPLEVPIAREDRIAHHWQVHRSHEPESIEAAQAFDAMRRSAADLGIHALPVHSMALLADAREAGQLGQRARARLLVERAEGLAPGLPAHPFVRSWLEVQSGPLGAVLGMFSARGGWAALQASPATEHASRMFVLDVARHAALVFALLVALGLFFRRWRHAAMDLRVLSRFTVTPKLSLWLVLALALTPALLLGSPGLLAAGLIAVTGTTLDVRERVVALLGLAALWASLALVPPLVEEAASAPGERLRLMQAAWTPCDARCRERLNVRLDSPDGDVARLALAWVHWRDGRREDHRRATALIDEHEWPNHLEPWVVLLRGNLAYAARDAEAAREHWEAALEVLPTASDRASALLNLTRLSQDMGDQDGVRTFSARAIELDGVRAIAFLDQSASRSQNLVLEGMTSLPPVGLGQESDPDWAELSNRELAAPTLGLVERERFDFVVLLVAAWILAGLALWLLGVTARSCIRCGTPTSRLMHERSANARHCVGCNQLDLSSAQLSRSQQQRRERRIDYGRDTSQKLATAGAVFFPGGALLAAGRPVLGTAIIAAVAVAVGLLRADRMLLQVPYFTEPTLFFDGVLPLGIILLALSLVASPIAMVLSIPHWQR